MTYIAVLLVVAVIVAWKCRRWVQHWNLLDKGIRQMKEEARGFAGYPLSANPYFAIEMMSYSGGPRNDDGPGHGGSSAILYENAAVFEVMQLK